MLHSCKEAQQEIHQVVDFSHYFIHLCASLKETSKFIISPLLLLGSWQAADPAEAQSGRVCWSGTAEPHTLLPESQIISFHRAQAPSHEQMAALPRAVGKPPPKYTTVTAAIARPGKRDN